MSSGYVLSFSNRTFEVFFREVVGIEIFLPCYGFSSGSKANRMRAFWERASDDQLRRLLRGLYEGWEIYSREPINQSAKTLISQILARMGDSVTEGDASTVLHSSRRISEATAEQLHKELLRVSNLPPLPRGFAFEKLLKQLFDAYGLASRASFRITGEQIDGSFVLHNDTYLLEAKWQNLQTPAADLHVFEGKLSNKASWSRGLFISNSGFSNDGLEAFGRGKRFICMDGYDLSEVLKQRLCLVEVIEAKVRRAAETGAAFASVRDLFS